MFIQIILVLNLLLLLVLLVFNWRTILKQQRGGDTSRLLVNPLMERIRETESRFSQEFVVSRRESADIARDSRLETNNALRGFTSSIADHLLNLTRSNEEKLDNLRGTIESRLLSFHGAITEGGRENRQELKTSLEGFRTELNASLKNFGDRQKESLGDLLVNLHQQHQSVSGRVDQMRVTVEQKITSLQEGNEKKLDEMRRTVDEKLNETLEKRLGESFRQVSDRLDAVHKGLGEMQSLAGQVGDLRKVMSNVKSRGVLGEYQLQNLIEDLLTNEQYEKNVKTKKGSGAFVEFAIKMPHGQNLEKTLWLPVDSKFPKEDYEALVNASEQGDMAKIEEARKAFIRSIRKNAQDIREKYIDPPNTTEYGIMFLPYESLFGEVLRTPGLFEQLQKEYKITITGPTTLSALLNSLQMGFRTLAIEKRSSEVWDLLGAVKNEFGQFGDTLAKTKKKLMEATNVIDQSELRSRAIERKLRKVQELPKEQSAVVLALNNEDPEPGEDDEIEPNQNFIG